MTQVPAPDQVHGFVAEGFEEVRDVFASNFVEHDDLGASCAVHDGERFLVHLWGGDSDEAGTPWLSDTLCLAYSVTKGLVTVLVARLVEEGLLELDELVQTYWPEFGVRGKGGTTVRMLLAHRAGLPTIEPGLNRRQLLQAGVPAARLAAQAPMWEPGQDFGYHALTWGWLVDELLFRVTGERVDVLIRRKVAEPLGVEVHVGLAGAAASRVADLSTLDPVVGATPVARESLAEQIEDSALRTALQRELASVHQRADLFAQTITAGGLLPLMDPVTWNSDDVRRASIPGANAITNARAVARIYAAVTTDRASPPLVSRATLEDFTVPQSEGTDRVTGFPSRFGAGFMLPTAGNPMYSEASFGHEGVGGAQGFADVEAGFGFGFVPNRLRDVAGGDPRVAALVAAVRRARN
ncbi:serine hydrolase domain-containing protein [Nocardioides hungaricus]